MLAVFLTPRLFKSEQPVPCELGRMRRAVFGEPLRAHPAKIGRIDAPGNACVIEQHGATGGNENWRW